MNTEYDINAVVYNSAGEPTGFDFFVDYFTSEKRALKTAEKICSITDLKNYINQSKRKLDIERYNFMRSLAEDFHPEDGEYIQLEVSSERELTEEENECGENFEYGPVIYKCKLC
jgi:hypothetical protein